MLRLHLYLAFRIQGMFTGQSRYLRTKEFRLIVQYFGFDVLLLSAEFQTEPLFTFSFAILHIYGGDTMQKWHIFRKNEKFSKRSDGFLFRFILFKASDWGYK